jgi:hypothetical protein
MTLFLLLSLITFDGKVTVRLLDPISSVHSRTGDRFRAVMVSPPTGAQVEGTVTEVKRIEGKQKRAVIRVEFDQPGVTLEEVDNARELVSDDGRILGMPLFRLVPTKTEDALLVAAYYSHPMMVALFAATKVARREADKPEINYPPGTELILQWDAKIPAGTIDTPGSLPDEAEIESLVQVLPSQTTARNKTFSDLTNLLFIGDEDKLKAAFLKAGWQPAQRFSPRTILRGFFAVAQHHSYKQAPVSAAFVQQRLPDLVFQKQNNTVAKRDHIRIWRQQMTIQGRPVWLAAATHDVGIVFSKKAKTFTHRIDPHIDLERQKIIDDFVFAEHVKAVGLIPRPEVPKSAQNATGNKIESDGGMAVLVLK